jgi:hypothetical protein
VAAGDFAKAPRENDGMRFLDLLLKYRQQVGCGQAPEPPAVGWHKFFVVLPTNKGDYLHMRFTIRSIYFVLFMTLSTSCGAVVTPKPSEQPPTLPIVTLATATETMIPTITNTPTVTETPTETAIPVPDYYKGVPPSRGELVNITTDQVPLIVAKLLEHSGLKGKPKNEYGIETNPANGGAYIFITCWYGDSCLIDTGATVINPSGGPYWDVLFIELIDPDGTHRVAVVCFDGIYKKDIEQPADNQLNWLQNIPNGWIFSINIITILGEEDPKNPYNPAAMDLTDNAPEKNKELFKKLRQTGQSRIGHILPDGIEQIIWYGGVYAHPVPK